MSSLIRPTLALALLILARPVLAQNPAAPAIPVAPSPATPAPVTEAVEDCVVKIFATMRYPDAYRPWTKQAPSEVTGSGVVIEGRRILTNAHVVLYASQVQVQANQSGDKFLAKVVASSPGMDLALLEVEDEAFFNSRQPAQMKGGLPDIKDTVLAYGFPTGGNALSITKGIISRIEFTAFNYPASGLRIQIDAAINPGNSGGPAFVGDRMIGVAFSRLGGGDNIGYIIPNEEIEIFIQDVADGRYDGKPALLAELQTLENPALRSYLKLDRAVEGVVVRRPDPDATGSPLKQWDVITHIGDTPIDAQGMIKHGTNLRLRFAYRVQHVAKEGKVPLTVVREGKTLQLQVPVAVGKELLIPDLKGEYPSYFVYGPLVFSKATVPFLGFMNNNANMTNAFAFIGSPLVLRRSALPAFPDEELVVVASPFFPHRLAKGYSNPSGGVLDNVNGQRIRNLRHLVEYLRDLEDEFVRFECGHRGGEVYVFTRKEILEATEDILTDNGVRSQASPDLLEVWNAKPAKR